MSGPTRIDPHAAQRTEAPDRGLARRIADESALTWLCSFCGLLRAYEGRRPIGPGRQNDCRDCGGRLAASLEDRATIAQHEGCRRSVAALMDTNLF
jgi:hypothetical protein